MDPYGISWDKRPENDMSFECATENNQYIIEKSPIYAHVMGDIL